MCGVEMKPLFKKKHMKSSVDEGVAFLAGVKGCAWALIPSS